MTISVSCVLLTNQLACVAKSPSPVVVVLKKNCIVVFISLVIRVIGIISIVAIQDLRGKVK